MENIEESSLEENESDLSNDNDNVINQEENNEIEEQEQEESISIEDSESIIYNPEDFNLDFIIKYLMKNNIILSYIICDKCEQPMKLVKNKMKKDKIIWRCQKKGKINIKQQ